MWGGTISLNAWNEIEKIQSLYMHYKRQEFAKSWMITSCQRIFYSCNAILQENGFSTKVSSPLPSNLPPLSPTPTHFQQSSSVISNINYCHIGGANISSSFTSTICVALPSQQKLKVNQPSSTN